MSSDKDCEVKLFQVFKDDLVNISQQRLRALHMSFRRYGNIDLNISSKDLQHAFDENQMILTTRQYQVISELFEDNLGINFEQLYKALLRSKMKLFHNSELHNKTDFKQKLPSFEKQSDDILKRLEELLIERQKFFDIQEIRTVFQKLDINKTGKIKKDKVLSICSNLKLPVYGALLKFIINYCCDTNDNISWPDIIYFFKTSQERAWSKHPSMSELPSQVNNNDIVNPDVVDELSSSAKSKIVSKLLKKANFQREKSLQLKVESAGSTIEETVAKNHNETTISISTDQKTNDQKEPQDQTISKTESSTTSATYSDQMKVNLQVNGKVTKIMKPSGYNQVINLDSPKETIQLEWVYGYRGNDCRKNIYALDSGEIVYFISNIVIIYNKDIHKQKHYVEHTEDVKCLAIHTNGMLLATGQQSSKDQTVKAHIRIWRVDDLQTIFVLGDGMFEKSVMCVAYQINIDTVAAIDNGTEKKLTIWNTYSGELIAETMIQIEVICDISFNVKSPELLVTVGKEHLCWWKVNTKAKSIVPFFQADYETYLKAKFVICATHNSAGDLITGDSNGTIYVWGNGANKITNFVKHGHEGPVFTLLILNNYLLSGGRDGILCCWEQNKNMDCVGKVEVMKTEGGIRMVQVYKDILLIGTTMNSMLMASVNWSSQPLQHSEIDPLPITQGHFDKLKGLSEIQRSFIGADFITAGTDGIICKFNAVTHEPAWKLVMKGSTFLCVDCSTNGKLICLGTQDGYIVIMEINVEDFSVNEALHRKISKERLDCIALSPDDNVIAVGGFDRSITIYNFNNKENGSQRWQCIGKCWGHKGHITAIDWSAEMINGTYYLQSSSSYPEQLFWNSVTCEKADWKDIDCLAWKTQHCMIDYNVLGIWCSTLAKDTTIKTVAVNSLKTLLAVGDSQGNISLFRYPCQSEGAYCHKYQTLMNIETLCFSSNDKYIIAVGGIDSCITQWKVIDR